MKNKLFFSFIFGVLSALSCANLWPADIQAQFESPQFRYRYVSLDAALPTGFTFFAEPMKITDAGRVYLTAYACDIFCSTSIVTYQRGTVKIIQQNAIPYDVNSSGVIGGSAFDAINGIEQAAFFDDGAVKLLARMPGEVTSHVMRITDSGIALVQWSDDSDVHYYTYRHGKASRLDFGARQVGFLDINDEGIIAGTLFGNGGIDRGFRLNPSSGKLTVLNPLPTEPASWGQAINSQHDVLGYSFIPGKLERIGVWHGEKFSTYIVEGTPQFPTISNQLLWNRRGLIVITNTSRSDLNSYLVPKPGTRLNLADLVETLPRWTLIESVNQRGDLVGIGGSSYFNGENTFLLERIDAAR